MRVSELQTLGLNEVDLWLAGNDVVTLMVDPNSDMSRPGPENCAHINQMIQGLARAARAVVYHAENDDRVDTEFAMQPIESIAESIILLSQLSEGIRVAMDNKPKG